MRYIFFILIAVLFFSVCTAGAEQDRSDYFYIGAGGSYAIEDFNSDLDFDNSWGINGKIGYQFDELGAVQFDVDYLNEFSGDDSVSILGVSVDTDSDVTIMTFLLSLKGYFPGLMGPLQPFVIAGAGLMYVDMDTKVTSNIPGVSASDSTDETDFGFKIGLGSDYNVNQNVSLNFEGNYTLGIGDVDDFRYFNFILGASYRF